MLVLSRKINEEIVIKTSDGEVVITLVEANRDRCRMGFEAPETIRIYRREVLDRPQKGPVNKTADSHG